MTCYAIASVLLACTGASGAEGPGLPFVITQVPVGSEVEKAAPQPGSFPRAQWGKGTRLVVVYPDGSTRRLAPSLVAICDPSVSFDGKRFLFAGKTSAEAPWSIYEIKADGTGLRRVVGLSGDCRSPAYQPLLFTIDAAEPWYQITFVSNAAGVLSEYSTGSAYHLYSCRLDGSDIQRLTYTIAADFDPIIMEDGREIFATWRPPAVQRAFSPSCVICGINIDGTDYALYAEERGKPFKQMPCVTARGLLVFVESEVLRWDGSGTLGCVKVRRPLKTYRPLTTESQGLFAFPAALPDGTVLVSRRKPGGSESHAIVRFNPQSGRWETIFDDPRYHDLQAQPLVPRPEPDGRSSVVTPRDPNAKLYCLNVYITDLADRSWFPKGIVKRLRVLEGVPEAACGESGPEASPPLAVRRILGEIEVEEDGSFHLEVPANTPLSLQVLDSAGMALRSCTWIWTRNHENRGCIGCHEDGELTPENVLVRAVTKPAIPLTLPPSRRRTVDFKHQIMPLVERVCLKCHGPEGAPPLLAEPPSASRRPLNQAYRALLAPGADGGIGKYVHPGRARTSPLIWHLFGRNTSRPWDGDAPAGRVAPMPEAGCNLLRPEEKRTFVEWIDLGAAWSVQEKPYPAALGGGKP